MRELDFSIDWESWSSRN